MQRRRFATALSLCTLAPQAWSQASTALAAPAATPAARDVAGVRFEPTARVGNHVLKLNGAGVRWKAVFKVYAAGLYLAAPAKTSTEVLAAPGAKRIHLTMLRSVGGNEFAKILGDGIEKNASRDELMVSLPVIVQMGELAAAYKTLVAGDVLTIDWLPGTGASISIKGKPEIGPLNEAAFYTAMTKIWFGPKPADAALRDALLGLPVEPYVAGTA